VLVHISDKDIFDRIKVFKRDILILDSVAKVPPSAFKPFLLCKKLPFYLEYGEGVR
jgi:hypothetical protein